MTGPVFPEDYWVQIRYPLTREQEHGDRAVWPWLPGWVVARCGPDKWEIRVQAPELATWHEGTRPGTRCASGTPPRSACPKHSRTGNGPPNWEAL